MSIAIALAIRLTREREAIRRQTRGSEETPRARQGRCYNPHVTNHHDKPHLAVHCEWLRRTIEPGRPEPIVMLCQHPVRDGKDCIGPFLEDLATNCGLWEAHPQSHLIPLPEPERWQRRRREGFDYQRTW